MVPVLHCSTAHADWYQPRLESSGKDGTQKGWHQRAPVPALSFAVPAVATYAAAASLSGWQVISVATMPSDGFICGGLIWARSAPA